MVYTNKRFRDLFLLYLLNSYKKTLDVQSIIRFIRKRRVGFNSSYYFTLITSNLSVQSIEIPIFFILIFHIYNKDI